MNLNIQTVDSTNSVTLTNKTLDKSILLGTPSSAGQIGRNTTQLALNSYDNGMVGVNTRLITAGVGTQTLINNGTGDQDFTTLFQFPANVIFTNKAFRVMLLFEAITGVSTATWSVYLKLGSTKIYSTTGVDLANSLTRGNSAILQLIGRSAAGASASVSCASESGPNGFSFTNGANSVDQPVTGLATNGTLDLIFGVVWGATGSTESLELQGWYVEELN